MSWPSKRTSPAVGRLRFIIMRPTVDLPLPDSPASPNAWPASMVKLTSSMAGTRWPPGARTSLRRFRSSMIGKDSLMAYRSAFNHVVAWSPRTVPVSVTGEAALSSGGFPTGFLPFMGHGASLVVEPAADVAAVLEVDHRRPHVA